MSNAPIASPVQPRPAATIVVVRPGAAGVEVLMLRRAEKGDQNSGAWVFPGGLVDRADRACHPACAGLDDGEASRRLGLEAGGLDFYVAAVRECFEEAGLLFAVDAAGQLPLMDGGAGASLTALRHPVARGELNFAAVCQQHGLRLAADRLHYIAHWVTPASLPKRFDTRFFLALQPAAQQAGHDTVETLDHGWFRPADLLAADGSHKLLGVTRSILTQLAEFPEVDALMHWAGSPRQVKMMMRRKGRNAQGPQGLLPDHPAWAEVGRLDPLDEGTAWCELRPGVAVRLSPSVHRLTHEQGNAYLVGAAQQGWAAIDPAPVGGAQELWLEVTGGRQPVLLSTRSDPAAPAEIHLGAGLTLQRIATPGGNGWLLVQERLVFSGDWLVAEGSASAALRAAADWAAPAHGFLVPLG